MFSPRGQNDDLASPERFRAAISLKLEERGGAGSTSRRSGEEGDLIHDTIDVSAEGNLRINLHANPAATQPALTVSDNLALDAYTVRLSLHDVALKDHTWPDALRNVNGKIEIIPGTVSLIGMTGTMGNISLAWTGQTDPATGKMALSGDASSTGLPTQWLNHLPNARPALTVTTHSGKRITRPSMLFGRFAGWLPRPLPPQETVGLCSAGGAPLYIRATRRTIAVL